MLQYAKFGQMGWLVLSAMPICLWPGSIQTPRRVVRPGLYKNWNRARGDCGSYQWPNYVCRIMQIANVTFSLT